MVASAKAGTSKLIAAKKWLRHYRAGLLFMMPFAALFIVFVMLPVIVAFSYSFTNYNMIQDSSFIGIENYKTLFLYDDVFLIALKNTLFFALITGPIGLLMSFIMAWVINKIPFRKFFALAFYAPSITSGVAMSVVWMYFFSSDRYGFINNALINMGIITGPVRWNTDPATIMTVVIIISIWMSMGTGFLVFLAGLQTVSSSIYEAGMIDGVKNRFQELFYLTLPQMKPQLLYSSITSVVGAFGVFDIAVSVAGMPSPSYSAHTLVAHLYDYAFIRFQMGYASCIAIVLFVITFCIGQILMKFLSTKNMD